MSTQAKNPYQSARLTYRAVETEDHAFVHELETDPIGFSNSELALKRPQSKEATKKYLESMLEKNMLAVLICVTEAEGDDPAGKAIGMVNLTSSDLDMVHHQHTEIGIGFLPQYQGKGYGTEAIEWALEWAFESANMHRVSCKVFEYNPGARRLYERLGFKHEGTIRELFWHNGRWWDDHEYGMLASEWRARHKGS